VTVTQEHAKPLPISVPTRTERNQHSIWGAESPIELFLFQELMRRGVTPALQMLIYDEGSLHPSLNYMWSGVEFRHSPGLITESNMYFPEQKVAVFCDSTKYHWGAGQERRTRPPMHACRPLASHPCAFPGNRSSVISNQQRIW
jgi:hypothetical protein